MPPRTVIAESFFSTIHNRVLWRASSADPNGPQWLLARGSEDAAYLAESWERLADGTWKARRVSASA
jgi:hypothetical protein